jgi:hypothetical protein
MGNVFDDSTLEEMKKRANDERDSFTFHRQRRDISCEYSRASERASD